MNWKSVKNLLFKDKKARFLELCKNNNIQLDFDRNSNALDVFNAIFYEREYADYFPFYQKATIVDIGAHYGFFSLFASVNSSKDSKIISIEPDAGNYKKLIFNIADNHLSNIEMLNCAVSDKSGEAAFYADHGVNSTLITGYQLTKSGSPAKNVETKTVEQIVKEYDLSEIDFLKMDCEGAEYQILAAMPPEIFKKIKTISMEFHDMKDPEYTGDYIVNLLKNNGFNILKYNYMPSNRGLNFGKIIGTRQ